MRSLINMKGEFLTVHCTVCSPLDSEGWGGRGGDRTHLPPIYLNIFVVCN